MRKSMNIEKILKYINQHPLKTVCVFERKFRRKSQKEIKLPSHSGIALSW